MSDDGIIAREATVRDLDSIVAYNAEIARELEGKSLDAVRLRAGVEAVLNSWDKARGFYVVGVGQGNVIGVLHITYEWSPWRNATFWWLNNGNCRAPVASERRVHGDARARGGTG